MVLPIKRTASGDLSQVAPGDTLDLTVTGETPAATVPARALSAATAGASGAALVGVDTTNLTNSAPADTDLQTVLEALDAASGGGGGGTLQNAYDAGNAIALDATGAVTISDALGSGNGDGTALKVSQDQIASHAIDVTRSPASPVFAGNGVNVTMNANVSSDGVRVTHAGSGYGVRSTATGFGAGGRFEGQGANATPSSAAQTDSGNANAAFIASHVGTGPALRAETTGTGSALEVSKTTSAGNPAARIETQVSGDGTTLEVEQAATSQALTVQISNGGNSAIAAAVEHVGSGIVLDLNAGGGANTLINARAGAVPVLVVDPALLAIGQAANPVFTQSHTSIRLGTASGTTAKSFEAYTLDVGTDPIDVNNLGRLFWRPGTNTAPSTTADLALRAGSEGETLLTKGGRLYATAVLREFIIATGETLALGDVVAPIGGSGTCGKADPVTANGNDNAFGIVVVGDGPGDGIKRCLVAMGGYVDGLAGITANTPVYLSDTTPGLLTSTPPSASGTTSIRIGFAFTQSSVVIHVGEKVLIP